MAEVWDEFLVRAKYHHSVAQRMFDDFGNYETKRFLVGVINELALCASLYIDCVLLMLMQEKGVLLSKAREKRLAFFYDSVSPDVGKVVGAILRIRRARENSPVELLREEKLLYLDKGEYRVLTVERLGELVGGMGEILKKGVD